MTPTTFSTFGPIKLAEGVSRRHVLCFLYAAGISIGMFTYLMSLTPYILAVNLGIPEDTHGRVIGDLQFLQEIVVIISIGWWGAMSDRFGRRLLYIIAFLLMTLAYGVYSFAETLPQLFAFRVVFALGVAAVTTNLSTIIADYSQDESRGKMTGLTFILNGMGAVLFFAGLNQLPAIYAAQGASDLWAGHFAYLTAAAIAFSGALIMTGLKPGRPKGVEPKTPIIQLIGEGMKAASNKRIRIAYIGAFAARADMAIVTLFFILWVVQASVEAGLSPGEAQARAGMYVGIYSVGALLWAPIFGTIADRIDRLSVTVLAFILAAVAYGTLGNLENVLSLSTVIPVLLLAGAGQISTALAITVLLAQEAPEKFRGSVFGVQNFFGAIGILAMASGGGRLFDFIGPWAPFVAVAIANGLVGIAALALRMRELGGGVKARATT